MTSFKIGDKVERIAEEHCKMAVGDVSTVCGVTPFGSLELLDFEGIHASVNFKLYEEKNMFDMKKDKWFIRTPTPEISEAVQLWLFEQGFGWQDDGQKVLYKSQQFLTNTKYPHFACNYILHSNTVDKQAEENGVKEIKLTFKSSVYSVEYPVVETQAEKELKALEQKIQELTEQASKLRSVIK